VTVGAAVAARVLGSNVADLSCDGRLCRVERSPLPVGRPDTIERIRTLLDHPGELPLVLAGPDALELLMAASGRPAAILDARAAALPDCRDDLALAVALESRE